MTRYDVWLDQLSLAHSAPELLLLDVEEHQPVLDVQTFAPALGDGLHLGPLARQSLSVHVRFAVRARDPARRKAILQKLRTQAEHTRHLAVSDRPGQFLAVDTATLPASQSALKWAEDLTLIFTACRIPYWQQQAPTRAGSAHPVLCPPGDAPACPLDVTWQHQGSATAVTLTLITPLSRITLRQMSIAPGETLQLTHPEGILAARVGARDVLACRTPDSSDDLLLPCGVHSTVNISAGDIPHTFTLAARGRWL